MTEEAKPVCLTDEQTKALLHMLEKWQRREWLRGLFWKTWLAIGAGIAVVTSSAENIAKAWRSWIWP